jgi:hypothetical protein
MVDCFSTCLAESWSFIHLLLMHLKDLESSEEKPHNSEKILNECLRAFKEIWLLSSIGPMGDMAILQRLMIGQ